VVHGSDEDHQDPGPHRPVAEAVPAAGGAAPEEITERYRWIALGIVVIGTFMVILDTTIVTVALDPIGKDLGSVNGVEWIITAYLLAVGIVQPATGWLADRIGRKPVFLGAMVLFASGSLACAVSPSLGMVIFFRVIQGLGGGAMVPVGMAIIYEVFPSDRRGTAMGVWGIAAMAGPAIGPALGGWLVTAFDWRWLFLINVPIGAIGTVLGIRLLKSFGYREHRPLDWTGAVVATLGVTAVLLALSEGAAWGWGSARTVGLAAAGVVLLAVFSWWGGGRPPPPPHGRPPDCARGGCRRLPPGGGRADPSAGRDLHRARRIPQPELRRPLQGSGGRLPEHPGGHDGGGEGRGERGRAGQRPAPGWDPAQGAPARP
jgi:multidrug resistance protein